MNNEIDELWIEIPKIQNRKKAIVAISNTGMYRRSDGSEGILDLRHRVRYDSRPELAYRIIAEHFLITVRRPDQTCIDHITHHPTEYNVNNVLNLRWCTKRENSNFEEAIANHSGEKSPMYGRTGKKSTTWKGEEVGPQGAYVRAKKLYKGGKISEEDLQYYRDAWNEYKKARRKQISSQSSENR